MLGIVLDATNGSKKATITRKKQHTETVCSPKKKWNSCERISHTTYNQKNHTFGAKSGIEIVMIHRVETEWEYI